MNKKIKGYELYKMIAECTLKEGNKFIDENENNWEFDGSDFFVKDGYNTYTDLKFAKMDFEILEDEEEIQKLNPEECYFKDGTELVYKLMYNKINELVEKVNELEKNKVETSKED